MPEVDLGFAEPVEPWRLESRMFPSKIGGKPAWLSLKNLPTPEELLCSVCGKPMIFLCQVYAPYEEDARNFHRTIFIFTCRSADCCRSNSAENFKVFRSSLERQNEFYPFEPPNEEPDDNFDIGQKIELCSVCGCFGNKRCSKCKVVAYCGRDHQVFDWKENHKNTCGQIENHRSKLVFSEYEIVIETEENKDEKSVNESIEIEKFKLLETEGRTGTLKDVSESELQEHAQVDADKAFLHFKKKVSDSPDQILRYSRGGSPLYIADEPKPLIIPKCENCGSDRQFEFQIMPQLLSVLGEHSLDWGVLLVYTCKASCISDSYKKEYLFKQDVSGNT